MSNFKRHMLYLPAAFALAGCLDAGDPEGGVSMCESNSDCDTAEGEICDIGVCWGDPPDTTRFAAIMIPPEERTDLAPTELTNVSISRDGNIGGLSFGTTMRLRGKVVLACGALPNIGCDEEVLVPAKITLERDSFFPGGPVYRRTALSGITPSESGETFSIALPQDDAVYRMTIEADEGATAGLASAGLGQAVPPLSTLVRADYDHDFVFELGKPDDNKAIEGCVTSATGNGAPFAGMQVFALGRWTDGSELQRASAVVRADEVGCFSLSVPIDMENQFDIIARPSAGTILPTIRLSGEEVPDPDPSLEQPLEPHRLEPLVMPNAANPVTFKLPVRGRAGSGSLEPVAGATVVFETTFAPAATEERQIEIRHTAQAVSNSVADEEPGMAEVQLYPGGSEGNRSYQVRVLSTPDSEFESVFGRTIEVGSGDGAGVLAALELDRRVAVAGTFMAADGSLLADTPVSVRLADSLRLELMGPADRAVLENLQLPTDVTDESGSFFLWLDRNLLGIMARYDIELAPPDFSSAPRWSFRLSGESDDTYGDNVDMGLLSLPPASYARGQVTDSVGQIVPGSQLRWFELAEPNPDCGPGPNTLECQPPARLVGLWESDSEGNVFAILPDPE